MVYQEPVFIRSEAQVQMVPSERVLSGRVIRAFFATRWRNAWYGELSSNYFDWSFHLWPGDLMMSVESHRKQGASWWIKTIPSLAVASSDHFCCIVHPNAIPYHLRNILRKRDSTLREIAEKALSGGADSMAIVAPGTYLHALAEGNADVWRSDSYGGPPTPLEWYRSSDKSLEIPKEFEGILGELLKADWPCPGLRNGLFS